MDFETFETEFLLNLKNKSKKCFSLIDNNRKLIQANLSEDGNPKAIDRFVKEINVVVLKTKNNFSFIKKILNHCAFYYVYECFKNSDVLVQACKTANKPAIKWLLEMDINLYVQDDDGMSFMMYAAEKPELYSTVLQYIHKEDLLNLRDKNGENVIFHALRNNKVLVELVKSKVDINQLNNKNETALIYCCKNKIYDAIKVLIENQDIDVNFVDDESKTALMYLVEDAKFVEIAYLARRNCDFNFINIRLESALSILFNKMYGSAVDNKAETVYAHYIRTMIALVKLKCDFNIPLDEEENTAIMVLIIIGDFKTLEYVLRYGYNIDLSKKNKNGENASSLIVKSKNKGQYRYMTNNTTFDYEYVDGNIGNTMLMLASMNQPLMVGKIIDNNIMSVDEINSKKESALILATKTNNLKSVEELLKRDAFINQKDYLGNTALYYAVDLKNIEIIRKLMYKNPDINLKNNEGKSALDLAHEIENKTILELLTNPSGKTSYIPDQFSSIQQKVCEGSISDKYRDLDEYLYPWISNHYSNFKMNNTMEAVANMIYNEAIIKDDANKKIERDFKNHNSTYSGDNVELYILTQSLIELLWIPLDILAHM